MHLPGPEGDAPELSLTRRGVARLLGAAGFAAALAPAAASAITTPEEGLVIETVSFPSLGADLPAYVARPEGEGPFPVVIVVHEIFGLHEYIRDTARRFARAGYYAIVPDLYARAGDPSDLTDFAEIRTIVATADNAQVMSDMANLIDWLEGVEAADSGALGVTGFCWGGAVTWMIAAHDPRVKAGVAWYGRLVPRPDSDETPRPYPIHVAGDLRAPVLGLYGGQDRGIPVSDVEAMRAALSEAESASQIVLYDEAQHGFHADYRQSYDPEAASDGWRRALSWFRAHGVGAVAEPAEAEAEAPQ